jgi:hypothetical protein
VPYCRIACDIEPLQNYVYRKGDTLSFRTAIVAS